MSKSFYVQSYEAARRRWAEGCGDGEWDEWIEVLGRIKRACKWSVNGMLTQLDREDPEIWCTLGDAYSSGRGVERDVEQAEMWFRKAATAGHARSMTRLGTLLHHPDRSDEDRRESVEWYRRAAELGDSSGMTSLGFAYREGQGVPVDEERAVDWFVKAHGAGANHASELAGRLLAHRAENHLEAVKWLRIAVDHGIDSAFYNLALIHEDRQSPAHDPEEAFRCWLKVAERPRGDLRFMAMFRLVSCCRDGVGTARSLEEAKSWLARILATAPKDKSDYRHAAKLRREMDDELF